MRIVEPCHAHELRHLGTEGVEIHVIEDRPVGEDGQITDQTERP